MEKEDIERILRGLTTNDLGSGRAFKVADSDFALDVSRGLITGVKTVNKFGKAPDGVDAGVETDIWTRADISNTQPVWLAPTAARIHSIVSSNAVKIAGPAIIKLSCSSVGGNDIGVSACFDGYLVTN